MQNDLISRSLLLAVGNVRKVTEYDEGGWGLTYRAVPEQAIKNAPAVDAVPVVRCSECKKCRKRESKLGIHWCNQWDNVVRDKDFCSFGERKADGGADT